MGDSIHNVEGNERLRGKFVFLLTLPHPHCYEDYPNSQEGKKKVEGGAVGGRGSGSDLQQETQGGREAKTSEKWIWKDRTLHGVDLKHLLQGDTQTLEDPAARHPPRGTIVPLHLPGGQDEPLKPQWQGDQLQGPENRHLSREKSYNGSPQTFTPPRERIIPKHLRGSLCQVGWLEAQKKKKKLCLII